MPSKRTLPSANSPTMWDEWQDCGQIGPFKHIRIVKDSKGQQAVLKKSRSTSRISQSRFEEEARGMLELSKDEQGGILPVLDIDSSSPPNWFVMPLAQSLAEALGPQPDLRQVVQVVEHLATTLIALADKGIAHRDIKPPNLFYLNNEPLLGDLGIATWPMRSDLTRQGCKMGPAYFLAPEMRRHESNIDYFRADVWSLAKSLFVLALPERGPYPPDGTHYVLAREFSLWRAGQEAGSALNPLLEAATQFEPAFRLTMRHFREELRDWLDVYPAGAVQRRTRPGIHRGWQMFEGDREQIRRRSRFMREAINAEIRHISGILLGDEYAWTSDESRREESATEEPPYTLADYDFTPNSEDGFEPDDSYFTLTRDADQRGRRFALWGVLDGDTLTLFAEIHRVDGVNTTLETYWHNEATVLLPSCAARLAHLRREVIEWVAQN